MEKEEVRRAWLEGKRNEADKQLKGPAPVDRSELKEIAQLRDCGSTTARRSTRLMTSHYAREDARSLTRLITTFNRRQSLVSSLRIHIDLC